MGISGISEGGEVPCLKGKIERMRKLSWALVLPAIYKKMGEGKEVEEERW